MVNDFLKNGCYLVRNKLLKIVRMIFEKGKVPSNFTKTLIKPLCKKGDKSKCGYKRGINLVSEGSKLLRNMILFRLRDTVDKLLREEPCGFRMGRGSVDQVFTLRLIIEKYLSHQTFLTFSFIDYEHAFNSADRTALKKVLSLIGINFKKPFPQKNFSKKSTELC